MQLRAARLPEEIHRRPMRAFVSLSVWMYRSFFGAILNGALLLAVAGILLVAGWTQGSFTPLFWVLPQVLLLPVLMALEEFLHLWVCFRKGLSQDATDIVMALRITAGGKRLICYGCAVRYRGHLTPLDKIHISAPGPLFCLLIAAVLGSILLLDSRTFFENLPPHRLLPLVLYLLSPLRPCNLLFPTDLSNIIRAKKAGRYTLMRTLGACGESLRLIWSSSVSILDKKES